MRSRTPFVLAVLTALLLTACGGGDPVDVDDPTGEAPVDPGTGDDPDGDPPAATGGILRAAIGGDPDQLDPHTTTSSFAFTILENVYDTLVQPGDDLTLEPALAESWDVSDDQLTWTFALRDGVSFHDGSALTAEDVIASYERIRDEGANGWRLDAVDSFAAPDDLTVEITLVRPAPNLLDQIGAFKGMAIAPAAALEAGTLDEEPVGTGPFRFVSFTPGDAVELEAFEDYWGDGPNLDGVEFRVIPDEGVKLTNLQTGEVDWIDSVPPEQLDTLEGSDELVIGRTAGNDYWYLALNNAREPYDDPAVRQAIAYALDIESITEAARFGAASPNETAIPETSFWYHQYAPFGYDTDRAQSMLDDAGVSGLSIDLMVTNEFPETVTAGQVIADQFGAGRHRRPDPHRGLLQLARRPGSRRVRRIRARLAGQHRPGRLLLRPAPLERWLQLPRLRRLGGGRAPRRGARGARRGCAQGAVRPGGRTHRRPGVLHLLLQPRHRRGMVTVGERLRDARGPSRPASSRRAWRASDRRRGRPDAPGVAA